MVTTRVNGDVASVPAAVAAGCDAIGENYAQELIEKWIGLAAGEPPTVRGFPPSFFATVPKLIERMGTSDRALREGLVYDLLGRLSDRDVRDRAVQAMAARYDVDAGHADSVRSTALKLLRQARAGWDLDPKLSEALLGWAASLHEIGLVIAHSQYHKHGEYILRHADLQGFSQTDQRLLAALVRLHRSKFSMGALDDLPSALVEPIQRLAMLFRLACLLHRSRAPGLRPPLRLSVQRRRLDLQFGSHWLQTHPLTQADLEQEAQYLSALQVQLRFA